MEKQRQIKLLSIVALVIAIAGMTLGFAAFSTTLNISSSATVTPNSEDFKIVAYGLEEEMTGDDFIQNATNLDLYSSASKANPINGGTWNDTYSTLNKGIATISANNNSIIINNIYAEMEKPYTFITYPILIKNEGKYDANTTVSFLGEKNCTPKDGTMSSSMTNACENIESEFVVVSSDGTELDYINDKFVVESGDYIFIGLDIYYGPSEFADGAFDITFPNIKLDFTTAQ